VEAAGMTRVGAAAGKAQVEAAGVCCGGDGAGGGGGGEGAGGGAATWKAQAEGREGFFREARH
jgi:hypothetical protein